jgi:hypothetical protein
MSTQLSHRYTPIILVNFGCFQQAMTGSPIYSQMQNTTEQSKTVLGFYGAISYAYACLCLHDLPTVLSLVFL